MPDITIEYIHGRERMWLRELHTVADDLESRYLRASQSELAFVLTVPGHGDVEGVLWCAPCRPLLLRARSCLASGFRRTLVRLGRSAAAAAAARRYFP